ncbi:MAG TPA: hypothetical protein VFR49_08760 [Solirubrobacteraceae bacterium]|nr:hypothetical protein [Solirubrobacteraceae bacterium]
MPAETSHATRPCVRCRVEINAASGYCTFCGAVQRRPRGGRWLAAAVGLVALAAAFALSAVLSAGSGRGGELSLHRAAGLVTLVPAGWVGGPVAAPPGVRSLAFVDSQDDRRRLIVTATKPAPANALVRARTALRLARTGLGYRRRSFGRVLLADGRPAWLLRYDANGSYHAVYIYSACMPTYAMTVEMRAPAPGELGLWPREVAVSAAPRC